MTALYVVYLLIGSPSLTPPPKAPSLVMPHPNAFDLYAKAAALADESSTVDYGYMPDRSATDPIMTPAQADAAARENMPAVKALHEAFKYPYMSPPVLSLDTKLPWFAKDRSLARVLAFEGRASAAHGDYDAALGYDVDACQMGDDVPKGMPLIGALVGYACQGIGQRGAWALVNHVSEPVARLEAKRLLAIAGDEITDAQALRQEEGAFEYVLIQLFRRPNWPAYLARESSYKGSDAISFEIMCILLNKQRVLDNYTRSMDTMISDGKLPYPDYVITKTPQPADIISALVLPDDRKLRLQNELRVVYDKLLAVQLALHAYKLYHGAYPPSLSALVPAYLPAVPVDNFTRGHPLQYRLSAPGYTLYSVGPDCNDDGGKPICDSKLAGEKKYHVTIDNQAGDIVAGINY